MKTFTSDTMSSTSFVKRVIETSCRSEFGKGVAFSITATRRSTWQFSFSCTSPSLSTWPLVPLSRDRSRRIPRFCCKSRSTNVSMHTPVAKAMIESRFSCSIHSQTQAIRSVSEFSANSEHRFLIESSQPQPLLLFLNQGMGVYIINWIDSECPEANRIAFRKTSSYVYTLSKASIACLYPTS